MMGSLPGNNGDESPAATAAAALHPHSHVWNTMFAFITSMSLKCAVELGIPEAVQRCGGRVRPVSLADLAADLAIPPAHAPQLGRLLRMLVHARFFACKRTDDGAGNIEEGYLLTPSSTFLLDGGATFVKAGLCPALVMPHLHLSSWFRGEHEQLPTAFHAANGAGLWEHAGRVAEFNEMFNAGIAYDADIVAESVVSKCGSVVHGVRSLVDVGGGTGGLARAMAKAFPDLKCIVLDLPHVLAAQPPPTTTADDKVVYVGGNMFEYIPPADVAFLKHVLHDYDDEDCVKILRQCKKAIPSKEDKGKVVIIDIVVNVVKVDVDAAEKNNRLLENQLFVDVHMLAITGGKEREEKEWAKIFAQADFTGGYNITPILDFLSLIEVFP